MNNMRHPQKSVSARSSVESEIIDISSLLASLWRGKIMIMLASLVMIVLGGTYAYVIATPTYRSTAVVMLNNREEQVVDIASVVGGLGSDTSVVNTEVEVLRGRILLGKVVDELALTEDPEFNAALRNPSLMDHVKGAVRSLFRTNNPPAATDDPPAATARADRARVSTINALLTKLTIRNIPQSLVFQVTVETTSPEKSAIIADTLVDLYILNQLEVKFEATEQATSWLTERVTDLQVSLEDAEERVNDFRASRSLISPEALLALEMQVNETRERIVNMQGAIEVLQQRLVAMEAADTPQEMVDAAEDQQLERLLPRIDERSVAQTFEERAAQLFERYEIDIARNTSQLMTLRNSLASFEAQIEQQSQDQITLQQLSREAEASRLLYEYFLSRLKETSAQQGIQQADSRTISPAVVPGAPAAPRKSMILAISAILGFLIGSAFVLLRESRNRSFRNVEQLETLTGYPAIGQIPMMPGRHRKDAIAYLKEKPSSAAAEAIRNLRTSVMLSNVDTPPKVIMTSSALSGEGKTTLALALALNYASMGKKVLLIEGDIRRRVFGEYLNTTQTEGIVSILTGARTFDEVVIQDDLLNADVLLGDKGQSNAADIFSSERFATLLKDMRTRYDVIIIDTPPVLIVPDARVIAQNVDALAFIVRWDRTERDQVIAALREFESVGRPVSGLVLNQISPRGMKRYGYGNSYGPYSAYGSKYYVN